MQPSRVLPRQGLLPQATQISGSSCNLDVEIDCPSVWGDEIPWVDWPATRKNRLELWGADASRRHIFMPFIYMTVPAL